MSRPAGPLNRTMPMPPRPGGVDIATTVSPAITSHWVYGDFAVDAVTKAFGPNGVVADECEVNNSALVGAHRIEAEWHMRGPDFFGGFLGHQAQFFLPAGAIVARVKD